MLKKNLFLLLLVLLAPCFGAVQELTVGFGSGDAKDLDPQTNTSNSEGHVIRNLFEGLVIKDPRTADPIPGIALDWKVSKDGKKYTFNLNPKAKWSDGTPVTAEDMVYSWTRLLEPKTAAENATFAYNILNGKEFNQGKLKDASKLGLKALSPTVFEVTLDKTVPYFIRLISHYNFYPVPKKAIEKYGIKWTRPENMISNGPFILKSWELNKGITIVKNPQYWEKDKVQLEKVHFLVLNSETEEKMFRAGKLHSVAEIPMEKIPYWEKEGKDVFHRSLLLGTYFYWMNVNKAPLDNLLVRRALNLAIDRNKITHLVTKGNQLEATAFVPPGCGGYQPVPVLPKDGSEIKKAQKYLAQAGYRDGKGFPKIQLIYNTNSNIKKIAEATQAMWKENLNIDVEIVNMEWKVLLDTMSQKDYFIGRASWTADYNDPTTFLNLFLSHAENNNAGWKNAEFDKWMSESEVEMSPKKRLELLKRAEAVLLSELPVLPIYYFTRFTLRSPKVMGWYENVEEVHPLKEVYLKD